MIDKKIIKKDEDKNEKQEDADKLSEKFNNYLKRKKWNNIDIDNHNFSKKQQIGIRQSLRSNIEKNNYKIEPNDMIDFAGTEIEYEKLLNKFV